jgi:nickel-dependent lactate racemase
MMPDKNSFRQDLEEIKNMISAPIFCLNVVLNPEGSIIAAFAGDPITVHREGIAFNIRISGCMLDSRVDGVITNSYPMDLNMKQSIKCIGNTLPALKPGGIIMGFLRAERGIDDLKIPEDSKPLWLVKTILRMIGPSRVMGFLERVRKGLDVERKFQIYYSMQLMRQYDLFLYVPSISDDEVKRMGFFMRCASPQEVIDIAIKKLGKNACVAVFPEGGVTFPIVKE